jgi:hypothetical protein
MVSRITIGIELLVRLHLNGWCLYGLPVAMVLASTVAYRDVFYADNAHWFPRCT